MFLSWCAELFHFLQFHFFIVVELVYENFQKQVNQSAYNCRRKSDLILNY